MIDVRKIDQRAERAEIARSGVGAVNRGQLVRIVLDSQGCGLAACNCSPRNFVTLSDGDTLLTVSLTDEQASTLRQTGRLDVER